MARKPGMSVLEMVLDLFKTFFLSIFRAFGRMLGVAFTAGFVGGLGGGAVSLIYGFPIVPWVIGGFVVCAILAIVLMFFVAHDL